MNRPFLSPIRLTIDQAWLALDCCLPYSQSHSATRFFIESSMKQSRRFLIITSMAFLLGMPVLSDLAHTLGLNSSVVDLSQAYAQEIGVTPSPTLATAPILLPSAQEAIQSVSVSRGVIRSRNVTINTAVLPINGTQINTASLELITFNPFDDVVFTGQKIRIEPHQLLPDGYVWIGAIPGDPYSQIIMAVGGGQIEASIHSSKGFYQITYGSNGVYSASQIDSTAFHSSVDDAIVPPPRSPAANSITTSGGAAIMEQSIYVIDYMIVYTHDARFSIGDIPELLNAIQSSVAATNQAYLNSGVNLRLNLVNASEINYTEAGYINIELDRLQKIGDGFMDDVHTRRNTYAADLVTLITQESDPIAGPCGASYQFTPPVDTSFESFAFSVIRIECLRDGETMVHDLGHLMGAVHDANNADEPGIYPYAYGYQDPQGRFHDIMAYPDGCADPCPRINYFSNRTKTLNGVAMGNANADIATTFNTVAPILQQFRGAPVQTTLTPTPLASASTPSPAPGPTSVPSCTINVPATNPTSLVNAINTANNNGTGNDIICLAANSIYTFTNGPYDEGYGPSALPTIRTPITILGKGATLNRTGNNKFRFLYIEGGALFLNNLRLTNGNNALNSQSRSGGAILNRGTLNIAASFFSSNIATFGGAIYNSGDFTITDSTFIGNSALSGGAIMAGNGIAPTNIFRTLFLENSAHWGGAIFGESYQAPRSDVQITITGSCFVRNTNLAVDADNNYPSQDIDASNNWWNSPNGPTISDGTKLAGDSIDVVFVAYDPFFTRAPSYCSPTGATLVPTIASSEAAPVRNYFTTGTITLSWGSVANAQIYEVQVARTNNFVAGTLVFTRGDLDANTLSILISPDLFDGTYYWHVRGCQGVGVGCGNWSATDSFVVDIP